MKKYLWGITVSVFLCLTSYFAWCANTDRLAISGDGAENSVDVFRVDSDYDLHLTNTSSYDGLGVDGPTGETTIYSGDVNLTGAGVVPSAATAGTYPGITITVYNSSSAAIPANSVVLAHATTTAAGASVDSYSTFNAILATTSVLGVSDAAIAAGAYGKVKVCGYALVRTTGPVEAGDILVSTAPNTANAVSLAAGRAAVKTGTQVVGTAIGMALGRGTAAAGGNLVPILVGKH